MAVTDQRLGEILQEGRVLRRLLERGGNLSEHFAQLARWLDLTPDVLDVATELFNRRHAPAPDKPEWLAAEIPCTTCGAVIGWHDPARFPRSGILSATCSACAAAGASAP